MTQRVGPYELTGELGRGAAGVVFRARDPRLRREVAIKLLTQADARQLERFSREARALAKVRHPNVVNVLEVGRQDQGHPYIVMDLVQGESLARRMARDGPLPVRDAVEVIAKIARAADAAHAQGVVHRDIKPENVIVAIDGEPRLTDFGLAKDLEDPEAGLSLTIDGRFIGTPGYASPEQAQQSGTSSPSADVYGLGATLYGILTGVAPFRGRSVVEIVLATLTHPAEPPSARRPDVDPSLDSIVLRCLEKAPASRFGSAADLAGALESWLQTSARHRVVLTPLPLPSSRSGRSGRIDPPRGDGAGKLRAAVIALGVAFAISAGFAGAQLVMSSRRGARWEERRATLEARIDELETAARRTQAAAPTETPERLAARRIYEAGWARYEAKDYGAASTLYEAAIEIDPTYAPAWSSRGGMRMRLADDEGKGYDAEVLAAAQRDVEKALELDPKRSLSWCNLGTVELRRGDFDTALGHYDRAVELDPDHLLARANRATARQKAGDLAGAQEDAERAVEIDPNDGLSWRNLGRIKHARGDPKAAIVDLDRAIALEPDEMNGWLIRAGAKHDAGDLAGSRDDSDRAIELEPEAFEPWARSGLLALLSKDSARAMTDLARAAKIRPDHVVTLGRLGAACIEGKDFAGAVAALDRRIELDPGEAASWTNRGTAKLLLGRTEDAIADLDHALGMEPDAPLALYQRATAKKTIDPAGAIADLERFLEVAPTHELVPRARKLLDELR